jgi:cytochrome c-type biogenesis protein CcmF
VRLYYKPFVVWIWGGAIIMCIGGIFSISDKRYRIKKMAKWRNVDGSKLDAADGSLPIVNPAMASNLVKGQASTAGEQS